MRRASQPADSTVLGRSSRFSALNFGAPATSTVVGDMGQPLDGGADEIEDDEGKACNLEDAMQRAVREGSSDDFEDWKVRGRRISSSGLAESGH